MSVNTETNSVTVMRPLLVLQRGFCHPCMLLRQALPSAAGFPSIILGDNRQITCRSAVFLAGVIFGEEVDLYSMTYFKGTGPYHEHRSRLNKKQNVQLSLCIRPFHPKHLPVKIHNLHNLSKPVLKGATRAGREGASVGK
jgi:hypothetical protein